MKILFLSTWFPFPQDNGSKIRVFHLLKALGGSHEVTLLSFSFDTAAPERAEPLHAFCKEVLTVPCDPFAASQKSSLQRFLSPAPVFTSPLPEMSRLVHGTLAEVRFDAVVASTQTMAVYALLAPKQVKKVLEEHNSLTRMMWDRFQAQASPVQRLRCLASWQKARLHEARLFRRFDLVTMVSDQDREISEQGLPGFRGRIGVVPNGVDCAYNRPGSVQLSANHLVFNGSMVYAANYRAMQYFLSEIYPLIQKQEPGISLTVTGSTTGVDLPGLHLDRSVRVSGFVEDVRPLVASASACVVPIREGGGTRLKILEAMALGTPVVSTSKGTEGLDVTSERDILIADEPEEFAAQVLRLLRDPNLRKSLSQHARRLVEQHYDWTQIGQHFAELVENTAEKQGQS